MLWWSIWEYINSQVKVIWKSAGKSSRGCSRASSISMRKKYKCIFVNRWSQKNKKSSLFEVTIRREVSCRFNLGVKAKIRLINNFLGYGFASLSKKWRDDPMRADENTHQAHTQYCVTQDVRHRPGWNTKFSESPQPIDVLTHSVLFGPAAVKGRRHGRGRITLGGLFSKDET